MRTSRIIVAVFVLAALSGCSLMHWSGHPTRISGISGVEPDPARPVAPAKEVKPFIAKMPLTYADYTKAARLYLDLADKYRKEAASHDAMKQLYEGKDPEMAEHCGTLSRQLLVLAAQCEEIGKAHEKKAGTLKPKD